MCGSVPLCCLQRCPRRRLCNSTYTTTLRVTRSIHSRMLTPQSLVMMMSPQGSFIKHKSFRLSFRRLNSAPGKDEESEGLLNFTWTKTKMTMLFLLLALFKFFAAKGFKPFNVLENLRR